MKASTLYLLCMAWFGSIHAQPTFEKVYLATASYKMNLLELSSRNILVGSAWYPGVSLIDPDGNNINSKCFYGDSVLTMGAIKKYTDNEYFFITSYRKDSCSAQGSSTVPYTHPAIGRMDSLGNIQDFRHYVLTVGCINAPGDLIVTTDKGLILWGREQRFFVLKVDSTGGVEWAKHFGSGGSMEFVKELPGGDLVAGINLGASGAVVARMDTDGTLLWCKSYIRPGGRVHDAVVEQDGSFVVTGVTEHTSLNMSTPLPASFQPKLFMMKLYGDGDVQWCRGYDSAPNHFYTARSSRITRTLDGNYAVLATLGLPGYNFFQRPFLMKTDLNGDTIWTRSTGANGYNYFTQDLLAYSDGGYMVSGGVWGDLPQGWSGAPYIFKTDSLGHFPCGEQVAPVQVVDLFPTDSSFVLTSVDGAVMQPAFVSDTIFGPTATYDACIVTAIPGFPTVRRANIRPNPNTGRFTVEFKDPLMAESYYSVYDAMGRLLLQRPLPAGSTTEQVDLSRYGTGTYVIKFTSPEGVQHERVVVE